MAQTDIILPTEPLPEPPKIRSIGLRDLGRALQKGLEDFWAIPTHTIFLCLIYPIVGIALGWATFGLNVIPLLFCSPGASPSLAHSPQSASTN